MSTAGDETLPGCIQILACHYAMQANPVRDEERLGLYTAEQSPSFDLAKGTLRPILGDVALGTREVDRTAAIVANEIVLATKTHGRPAGYVCMSGLVAAMEGKGNLLFANAAEPFPRFFHNLGDFFVNTFGLIAGLSQDAGLLKDAADLLKEELPTLRIPSLVLLGAAAHIEAQKNKSPDALGAYERLDPDVRILLMNMREKIPTVDDRYEKSIQKRPTCRQCRKKTSYNF